MIPLVILASINLTDGKQLSSATISVTVKFCPLYTLIVLVWELLQEAPHVRDDMLVQNTTFLGYSININGDMAFVSNMMSQRVLVELHLFIVILSTMQLARQPPHMTSPPLIALLLPENIKTLDVGYPRLNW